MRRSASRKAGDGCLLVVVVTEKSAGKSCCGYWAAEGHEASGTGAEGRSGAMVLQTGTESPWAEVLSFPRGAWGDGGIIIIIIIIVSRSEK